MSNRFQRFDNDLNRRSIFIDCIGLAVSLGMSAIGFVLARSYDDLTEFSQFGQLGFNPYREMAYKFLFTAGLFLLYAWVINLRIRPVMKVMGLAMLFILINYLAILTAVDSGDLPRLGANYESWASLLRYGGLLSALISAVLFVQCIVLLSRTNKKRLVE